MPSHQYINRELSWLQFNSHVLDEANCKGNPLIERLKFLAITAGNLDEFFMVRVGGLQLVVQSGKKSREISGLTAGEQLNQIRDQVLIMNVAQADCFVRIERELAKHDIRRIGGDDLNEDQAEYLARFVEDEVLSITAPVAVDRPDDFPSLIGARLCLCLRLAIDPDSDLVADPENESKTRYLIVPLGGALRRIVPVPCVTGYQYMFVEDVIGLHLEKLVGRHQVLESAVFRITRNADMALDEDGAADLLKGMQQVLDERTFGGCVRLELADSASSELEAFLKSSLDADDQDIYHIGGPLDYSTLFRLAGLSGFDSLRQAEWPPQESPDFSTDEDIFETIAAGDRLLSHPYQSYDPVIQFVQAAAKDPLVIAIKQTLYRTARNSQIVEALAEAAENGKNVTVIVELKARFDEARNIRWARQLELAGVDVIYGVSGLKTHAKICVVVRREATGLHRYMHFGTGNYNESTALLYGDISYFSDDEQMGRDSIHFFNAITGLSIPQTMSRLAAAPINMRESLIELIEIEIENAKAGQQAEIVAKLNSLVDQQVIDALYAASAAGVKIRLNIRGICCLRAGVPGLSENIRVISIIDRFLEHARIIYFRHGAENRIFISSADWMNRNLDKRVELMVPIVDEACKKRLWRILSTYFKDNVKARELQPDDSYRFITPAPGEETMRSQDALYKESGDLLSASTNPRTTVFKPHRGESSK